MAVDKLKFQQYIGTEPDLMCEFCGYKQHSGCVQWADWGSKFICKRCHRNNSVEWVKVDD